MNRTAIDEKWISIVGQQIDRFRWVKDNVANCRCFICGDSEKRTDKKRGYFYQHKGQYWYKCHNCGYAEPFFVFLNHYFPAQYADYKLDLLSFNEGGSGNPQTIQPKENKLPARAGVITLDNAPVYALDNLPQDHEAVVYVRKRGIPQSRWQHIYFTGSFRDCMVSLSNTASNRKMPRDPRILLFLRDENERIFGVQGRKIADKGNSPKYITVKFDDDMPKLFGLDRIRKDRPIIAVEGPIDSLYLPNAVAVCGGDVGHTLRRFKQKTVYVALDNEPRNKDTVARMKKAIDMGFKVTFWRFSSTQAKDIEEMMGVFGKREVLKEISKYSFSGLQALAELKDWSLAPTVNKKRARHQRA